MTPKETIERVIKAFDFDRVQRAMQAVDWRWRDDDSDDGYLPDRYRLQETARELLENAMRSPAKTVSCSSGGFEATKDDGELSLTFVLMEAYADIEEDQ